LVLDFVGNSGRHKLLNTGDILGGCVYEDEVRARAIKLASELKSGCNMVDLLEQEKLKLMEERKKAEERRAKDRARRANLKAAASFTQRQVDLFNHEDIDPTTGAWDNGRRLSPAQLAFLKRNGVDASHLTYKEGMQAMIKAKWRNDHGKPSDAQATLLGRFGLNPANFNRSSASKAIDTIKEKGWKLTHEDRQALQKQAGDRAGDRPDEATSDILLRAGYYG
jgi:hypothetical protein